MNRRGLGRMLCILAAIILAIGTVHTVGTWMTLKARLDSDNAVRRQVIDHANAKIKESGAAKDNGLPWLGNVYDTVSQGYYKLIEEAEEYMRRDFQMAVHETAFTAAPYGIVSAAMLTLGLILSGKTRLRLQPKSDKQ